MALATAAAVLVAPSPSTASVDASTLAHVRVTIESTSDWAQTKIDGVSRLVSTDLVSITPGDRVYREGGVVTLVGAAPSAVTVDLLLTITEPSSVVLDKGYAGEAATQVERLSPDHAVVAQLDNDLRIGDNQPMSTPVDATMLTGDGVDIPVLDDRRLTLAFYYPWWPTGSQRPNANGDGPSSAWHTDDPASVATMVDEAGDAGIDGFIVSWGGERTDGAELDLALDAATARGGFHVAPMLELMQFTETGLLGRKRLNVDAAAKAVRDALDRSHRQPFLHVGDRPVLFVWGVHDIAAEEWARLWTRIESARPFLVTEKQVAGTDGLYLYDPTQLSYEDLTKRYRSMYRSTHLDPIVQPDRPAQLFAATVSPGRSLSLKRPTTHRPREGGARYDRHWQVATEATPDWVLITSWNEWYEGTHVSPSTAYGPLALQQTATWTARFGG